MPKKTEWVVRIALARKYDAKGVNLADHAFRGVGVDVLITEFLRYAGVTKVVKDTAETLVFDLHRAGSTGTQEWAEMNAKRIQSFMVNAVAAPRYL